MAAVPFKPSPRARNRDATGPGPLSAFGLAVALAFGLSACGGGKDDSTSAAADAADSAQRATILAVVDPGGSSNGTKITTANVLCGISGSEYNASASVQLMATYGWTCNSTSRVLAGNGVPNHDVGTFPNPGNPNTIAATAAAATYTLTPSITSKTGTPAAIVGFAINSVKIDPGTAGTCDNSGSNCDLGQGGTGQWRIEALGQSSFNFGTDFNNAHVQPTGEYHYHGMPEGLITKLGGADAMRLVGWAADGFPIYARLGYVDKLNAKSGLRALIASYRTKAAPDANRPAVTLYPMGAFTQDYEYVAGLGDLDECNGRTGVTPEFPRGIYHYTMTDNYPFIQRCVKGTAAGGGGGGPPPGPPPAPVTTRSLT